MSAREAKKGGKRERRVALLGYWGVGKSSVVQRYVKDTFSEKYVPTIDTTYDKELSFQVLRVFSAIKVYSIDSENSS